MEEQTPSCPLSPTLLLSTSFWGIYLWFSIYLYIYILKYLYIFSIYIYINFLYSSAFLSYYSWHPEMVKRNGSIRLFPFLLGRWLRTTPMIVFTLLLVFAFPATLGSGPVFNIGLNNVTANCFLNWFPELAYYSNQNKAVYAVSSLSHFTLFFSPTSF